MRTVDSEWRAIQQLQITTESDIQLSFFVSGSSTATVVLTKQDIFNFSYKQNGSSINEVLPIKEIRFDCYKNKTTPRNFAIHQCCCVVFKYKYRSSNSWTSCVIGSFQVVNKEIKQNGLVESYVLNNSFLPAQSITRNDKYMDNKYNEGSNMFGVGFNDNVDATLLSLTTKLGVACSSNTTTRKAIGKSLPKIAWGEALQMCAVAYGQTLTFRGNTTSINAYNNVGTYTNIQTKSYSTNYLITDFILYSKPETLKADEIKSLSLTYYINSQLGYISYQGEHINCSGFGGECDDPNEYEDADPETYPYSTMVSIDPSQYWGHWVDKVADGWAFMDGRWLYIISDQYGGSEAFLYPLMKTETKSTSYTVSSSGTVFYVDNCLINENYQTLAKDYLVYCLSHNTFIDMEGRFDPRLELFDKIHVKSQLKYYGIIVEKFDITYSGGFKGKIRGRILSEEDVLPTPILSLNGNTLTIVNYNAYTSGIFEFFIYDENGDELNSFTTQTFDLSTLNLEAGNYPLTVRAETSTTGYRESDLSSAVIYSVALHTPTNVSVSGNIVLATVDDNTESVEIFIDDESIGEIDV